jgi:hypothetical protein
VGEGGRAGSNRPIPTAPGPFSSLFQALARGEKASAGPRSPTERDRRFTLVFATNRLESGPKKQSGRRWNAAARAAGGVLRIANLPRHPNDQGHGRHRPHKRRKSWIEEIFD